MSLHLLNLGAKGSTIVLSKDLRLGNDCPLFIGFAILLYLDEQMFEFWMLKEELTDVILVTGDGFSIALTESG